MKAILIAVVTMMVGMSECLPQYYYPKPPSVSTTQISSQPAPPPSRGPCSTAATCRRTEVSPGKFRFVCEVIDPRCLTISSEHILWLRGPNSQSQQLDVVIPNYRIEELIRAALKAGAAGGSTSVNILLKKPETVYDVQAQDGPQTARENPIVNLEYEAIRPPVSLHYPTDQAYNPLSGRIREP